MSTSNQKYASYNVLSRKALIFGVPILTLLLFLGLMLLTSAIGVMSMGFLKGIIIPTLLAVGLFSIRVICMDDSRAIEAAIWDLKAAITRLACRSNVTSFTYVDESVKKRKEEINEFYQINYAE